MLRTYGSLFRSIISVSLLFALAGCGQYHHLVPPPPSSKVLASESDQTSVTISITLLPGDKSPIAFQGGFFLGGKFGHGNTGAIGFGFDNPLIPNSFSFVLYDSLSHNLYGTYSLNLSEVLFKTGHTPSIEANAGVFVRSGDVWQSAEIGLAFMPNFTENYWSRWNLFSGSPHAAFIPKIGYNLFARPDVVGVAWYPGITRHLLKAYREPRNPEDTLIVIAKEEIDSRPFEDPFRRPLTASPVTIDSSWYDRLFADKDRSPGDELFARPKIHPMTGLPHNDLSIIGGNRLTDLNSFRLDRPLLKPFVELSHPKDTLNPAVAGDWSDSVPFEPRNWFGPNRLGFRLKDNRVLMLTQHTPYWAVPQGAYEALSEMTRFDTLQADSYWWVSLDTALMSFISCCLGCDPLDIGPPLRKIKDLQGRYDRILVLDTAAMMRHYRETGELEIRDDTERLRWLENTPIPLTRDLIFSLGAWLPRQE